MTNVTKIQSNHNRASDFIIRVKEYEDYIIKGNVEFSLTGESMEFWGLYSLLDGIQIKLDEYNYPQSSLAIRQWEFKDFNLLDANDAVPYVTYKEDTKHRILASFLLRIQFRQNACWQGSIIWLEGSRSTAFRSVLEMAFLLEQAVQYSVNKTGKLPSARPLHKWQAKEHVS